MRARTGQGHTTGRPPQRWARIACWTALISALAPVAWRIAMLCGVDLGFSQAEFFRSNASAIAYAPMLTLWAPALTVGLVGYWRRRMPE